MAKAEIAVDIIVTVTNASVSAFDRVFRKALPALIDEALELESMDEEIALLRQKHKDHRLMALCNTPSYSYQA